jgi:ATP-dependent Clp protease ATP-binding subunit ClpA
MFERFTAHARHTVVLAQEEARQLSHNYIGTEHVLLGLLGEHGGIAFQVLESLGVTHDGVRQEVTDMVGPGKDQPKGHIPFTPRAKKTLELSLREALALHHNYIGTEHILLGLIREGDGVAAQIMRKHADLLVIRTAVLDAVPVGSAEPGARGRRWLRRLIAGEPGPSGEPTPTEQAVLSATPAADTTLSEAARLAGSQSVGSHHLLLAALADSNSAAARVLTQLGVDLNQAKDALREADVTGTSDEQPEDAGRRQMAIQVTDELLTIVAADPVLVKAGTEALHALGDKASSSTTIHGRDLSGAAADNLAKAWQALNDTLSAIQLTAAAKPSPEDKKDEPGEPGTEATS